jgi:hypothetical protein
VVVLEPRSASPVAELGGPCGGRHQHRPFGALLLLGTGYTRRIEIVVDERTGELESINRRLHLEIEERQQVEAAVRQRWHDAYQFFGPTACVRIREQRRHGENEAYLDRQSGKIY